MRRLVLVAAALALLAFESGRAHGVKVAQVGGFPPMGAPAATGCTAPSWITTPTVGWDISQRINASYAGPLVRVVVSGGTQTDIGQVSGCLDSAGFNAACGGGCRGIEAYDQFASVNCTFASYAVSPAITLTTLHSEPALDNSGQRGTATCGAANDLGPIGDFAFAAIVNDPGSTPDGGLFGNAQTSSPFNGVYFGPSTQSTNQFQLNYYSNGNWHNGGCGALIMTDGNVHMVAVTRASTTATCQVDGSTGTQTGAGSSTTGVAGSMFGGIGGGTYNGKFRGGVEWVGTSDVATYRTYAQAHGAP